MTSRRRRAAVGALAIVAAFAAAPASAERPQTQRFTIDESFADEFLSEECGVDVVTTLTGQATRRTFTDEKGRLLQVFTINLEGVATAGDNTFRFRDVGGDFLKITSEGGLVLSIVGQVPFDFRGVLKLDPETEEFLHEANFASGERQLARACAALTA